ncbi:MAG: GNAT family N-acetyltransferase, partial [Acidobacteriaceae bacterium]|nr:GNAT family N-acetyltransferase [Acidobacteriaceae bacterium]
EDILSKFYKLLVMTRRRQSLPPQPLSWFRNLSRTFGNKLQVRLASYRGRPVASILTLKHGSTITYKYGASNVRFSNLGGTAFLFWRTIEEAKQEGITQFDLGRSGVDNEGLIRFKEHWGAQRSVLEYWRFPERPRSPAKEWSKKLTGQLAAIAPEWCLIAAGNLLYRHIG